MLRAGGPLRTGVSKRRHPNTFRLDREPARRVASARSAAGSAELTVFVRIERAVSARNSHPQQRTHALLEIVSPRTNSAAWMPLEHFCDSCAQRKAARRDRRRSPLATVLRVTCTSRAGRALHGGARGRLPPSASPDCNGGPDAPTRGEQLACCRLDLQEPEYSAA